MRRLAGLWVALALLAACTPAFSGVGRQIGSGGDEGRGYFVQGATYSCAGVVVGMAAIMGLDITLDVQSVAMGVCTLYAERVAKGAWDGGVLPRSEQPYLPAMPGEPL